MDNFDLKNVYLFPEMDLRPDFEFLMPLFMTLCKHLILFLNIGSKQKMLFIFFFHTEIFEILVMHNVITTSFPLFNSIWPYIPELSQWGKNNLMNMMLLLFLYALYRVIIYTRDLLTELMTSIFMFFNYNDIDVESYPIDDSESNNSNERENDIPTDEVEEEYEGDDEDNDINVEDNDIDVRNNDIDVEDNDIDVRNNDIDVEDNDINVEDNDIDVRNNDIDVEDNDIDVKNNDIDVKDNNIDVKNNDIDVEDNDTDDEDNDMDEEDSYTDDEDSDTDGEDNDTDDEDNAMNAENNIENDELGRRRRLYHGTLNPNFFHCYPAHSYYPVFNYISPYPFDIPDIRSDSSDEFYSANELNEADSDVESDSDTSDCFLDGANLFNQYEDDRHGDVFSNHN